MKYKNLDNFNFARKRLQITQAKRQKIAAMDLSALIQLPISPIRDFPKKTLSIDENILGEQIKWRI